MAVTITLLNFRESSMPYVRTLDIEGQEGRRTFARQYQATVEVLVEGPTADFMTWKRSLSPVGSASGGSLPPDFFNIQIDDQTNFIPSTDLNPNPLIEDKLVYVGSGVTGNYDKVSSYGKMSGTLQLDITGPVEYIDPETSNWEILDPPEY